MSLNVFLSAQNIQISLRLCVLSRASDKGTAVPMNNWVSGLLVQFNRLTRS